MVGNAFHSLGLWACLRRLACLLLLRRDLHAYDVSLPTTSSSGPPQLHSSLTLYLLHLPAMPPTPIALTH